MSTDSPDSGNPFQSPISDATSYSSGIDPSVRTAELLRQTRPWVLVMAVLLAIGIGFLVLGVVFLAFGVVAGAAGGVGGAETGVFGVMLMVYVVMIVLYWFPMMYLFKYASRINDFTTRGGIDQLDSALEAQKSFWKFVAIGFLVFIALYFVFIAVVLLGGIAAQL